MWNLTTAGFASVVAYVPAKDPATTARLGLDLAGDYLLVRGRDKQQIEYIAAFTDTPVDADTAADYKYRTIVTRQQYKDYMCAEIDSVRYTSHYKEESMKHPVNKGFTAWQSALYAIWYELEATQDTAAYSSKIWSRKDWDYPQTGSSKAVESAGVFATALGWDSLLDPEEQGVQLELPRSSADGYRFTDRMTDELDDPWLWDHEFSSALTDNELAELQEFDDWHRANEQIVRENSAVIDCTSDAVAGTVNTSPTKQRRRNRRKRNLSKGK